MTALGELIANHSSFYILSRIWTATVLTKERNTHHVATVNEYFLNALARALQAAGCKSSNIVKSLPESVSALCTGRK